MMQLTIGEIENNPFCRFCNTPTGDIHYRFCDSDYCQALYIRLVERRIKMNHPFNFQPNSGKLCSMCNRDFIAHTKMAKCESCNNQSECELVENKLLCPSCVDKHVANRTQQVIETKGTADALLQTSHGLSNLTPEQLLNKSRTIDASIRWNGDFFNAETVSHVEVKAAIYGNSLIPEESKAFEFQNALMERFLHFQSTLFETQQKEHELLQRMAGVKSTLREYGNNLRKEYQDKLKEQDVTYIPSAKPVKVKVANKRTKATNAYENLIKTIMESRKVTRGEALKIMIDLNLHKVSDSD